MILLYETGHQFDFWGRSILQRNEWRSGKRKIQGSLDACNWRTERKFGLVARKWLGKMSMGGFPLNFRGPTHSPKMSMPLPRADSVSPHQYLRYFRLCHGQVTWAERGMVIRPMSWKSKYG